MPGINQVQLNVSPSCRRAMTWFSATGGGHKKVLDQKTKWKKETRIDAGQRRRRRGSEKRKKEEEKEKPTEDEASKEDDIAAAEEAQEEAEPAPTEAEPENDGNEADGEEENVGWNWIWIGCFFITMRLQLFSFWCMTIVMRGGHLVPDSWVFETYCFVCVQYGTWFFF